MSKEIVSKFGGSSVANAEQIRKVFDIVESDHARRYVVVSAPGKGKGDAEKMTDHLLNIGTAGKHFRSAKKDIDVQSSIDAVIAKFNGIISDLAIEADDILDDLQRDLESSLPMKKRVDFLASRGEHFNARIIARYFNKEGLKSEVKLPEEIGMLVTPEFGNASVLPASYKEMKKLRDETVVCVVPGFYGITEEGDVAVFSRGGSDLTGGELAYAVGADLYENWTDTDGIYQVDPRIIRDSKVIPRLTYKEIRLLSSKGFNVFHFDAMLKCKKKGIPINIRNTNNPSADGTMIVAERVPAETVVGIARRDDIAYLYLEKDNAGERVSYLSKLLSILKDFGIETLHYPTDKDDISVLIRQDDLVDCVDDLRDEINRELNPDVLDFKFNISIISPVGLGMKDHPGVIAEAAIAFKADNINIEIIDQGPAQISFHFGIQNYYADAALNALYSGLIKNGSV